MVERRCRYCELIFQPSKYQPGQSVCDPRCQRLRRAEYHRQKTAADPEYRQLCLDSPQKWRSRNPDYWRRYREQHPATVERNRQQQHVRDQKRRLRNLANNNSAFDLKHSAAGVWLLGAPRDADVAKIVNRAFAETETFFRSMIERGQAEGEISKDVDPVGTAQALLGMLLGMRVLARSGSAAGVLKAIAAQAVASLE